VSVSPARRAIAIKALILPLGMVISSYSTQIPRAKCPSFGYPTFMYLNSIMCYLFITLFRVTIKVTNVK
jgi:hypothetical protein